MRTGRHNVAVELQQTKLGDDGEKLNRKLGSHFSSTNAGYTKIFKRADI